jgi:DNA-binding response OmpR family regulator
MGKLVLPSPETIIVIAPDLGLRQALTFALEVEGYRVEALSAWCPSTVAAHPASCVIIDDQALSAAGDVGRQLAGSSHSVITLSDGMSLPPDGHSGLWLPKPFEGAELLRMVRSFALAA